MADDKEVNVKFTADVKGFVNSLKEAQEKTETATAGMTGNLGSLLQGIEHMGVGGVAALAAVGLAFEALKKTAEWVTEAVHQTLELTDSFERLNYAAGLSTKEIDEYDAALKMSGGSLSDLEQIQRGHIRGLKQHADALVANGIAANKAALSQMGLKDYIEAVVKAGDKMSADDRGRLYMDAFGRSGMQFETVLKKVSERMGEAGEAVDKFSAHLGEEDIKALEDWEKATGEMNYAWEQFKLEVTRAVLPVIQAFVDLVRDNAEPVMGFLKVSLQGVGLMAISAAMGIEIVSKQIRAMWQSAREIAVGMAEMTQAALNRDWNGVKAAAVNTAHGVADANRKAAEDSVKAWEQGVERMRALMFGGEEKKPTESKKKYKDLDKEKMATRMQIWESELREKEAKDSRELAKDNIFYERSREEEEKFWNERLARTDLSEKERVAIKEKVANLGLQADRQNLAEKKAQLDADIAAEKDNLQKKRDLAVQEMAMHEKGTKGYEDARRRVVTIDREIAEQKKAINKLILENERDTLLDGMQVELDTIREKESAGLISKKKLLEAEKQYELAFYAIKRQEAMDAAMAEPNPVRHQELLNRIEAIDRQHEAKVAQINRQAADQTRQRWQQTFQAITSGFGSAIQGLVHGTMTWGQAWKTVLTSALDGLINMLVQWGLKQAEQFAMSLAMGETTRTTEAMGAAAVYAVNAAQSVAAIPMVGWMMAPGVMAEAYASGMSMAGLASAAGGWDRVPSDQLAMIHKNEMILPAHIAEPVRQMAQGGGPGGGDTYHFNITAMDGRDVERVLMRHRGAVAKVSRSLYRDGRTS